MMTENNRSIRPLVWAVAGKRGYANMWLAAAMAGALILTGSLVLYHCARPSGMPMHQDRNDLAQMARHDLLVAGKMLHLWIAHTPRERELGLMWVPPGEMADNQGMLFLFEQDEASGFWMKNTLTPLDIAFIRQDGTVVDTQQMEPLSLVSHAPRDSYRYALELKAGTLARLPLQPGDILPIPAEWLNP
jgi:uncharacterized protein